MPVCREGYATRRLAASCSSSCPSVWIARSDGLITLAADEQVRHAIGRVFELWRRCGSARQIVGELIAEDQLLPRRRPGEQHVRWARASYPAVHDLLTNPAYAGAFVFGRTRTEKTLGDDGRVRCQRRELPLEEWSVCIRDHHPGYVSWEEYQETRARLRANVRPRGEGGGAAREGAGLLQGILRCGRCGRRMQVAYSGTGGKIPRYTCARGRDFHVTGGMCQSLGGVRLDRAVTQAFLEAVTPAGVGACAAAITEIEDRHAERIAGRRLAVERAMFEAERRQRQYDACEPENRLVARTLEARLEEALVSLERERRALAELEQRQPEPLSGAEREALARHARELPRLWDAPTTTPRERKELLRTLIVEVVVTVHGDPRRACVEIRWEGGARSELTVPLTRGGRETGRTPESTIELIRRLARHHPDHQIAAILNKQRRRTGTGLQFTEARVAGVRERAGIPIAPPPDLAGELHTVEARSPRTRGRADNHLPLAQDRPAPRRADDPARPLADPAHRRHPPPIRRRRPRRIPPARAGRQAARHRSPDRSAQGPTRRAARDPGHERTAKRPQNQGFRRDRWTV